MDSEALVATILRATARERVLALRPLLEAADAALEALGREQGERFSLGLGAETAALVERWREGEDVDEDHLAHALQRTAHDMRSFGSDDHSRHGAAEAEHLLTWINLVQVAFVEVLGLDAQALLTRPTRHPEAEPDEAPFAMFGPGELELPPDAFEALLRFLLVDSQDVFPRRPAIARALLEVASRLSA